ncbi:UNVERIFIED_CONTAM: hypothetical protein FKN15_000347 [Acipenser sinensis]
MNTYCPPKRVPSTDHFFTHCGLTMQPPQIYSVGGQRSSWAAYRQARRCPARLQGTLVRAWLSHTWHWEPLTRQQAQALAVAPAQPITPAPELTPPAPVVAPDVTELDVSIAEEDHDVILSWSQEKSQEAVIVMSQLIPVQSTVYLGLRLDSLTMRAYLSDDREAAILNCLTLFNKGSQYNWCCVKLLGLVAAASYPTQLGLLHMRPIQVWLSAFGCTPSVTDTID